MRPITGFAKYMTSWVTIEPRSGSDAYGKPTYGAPVPYRAHIAKGTRLELAAAGQEVRDSVAVSLMSAVPVLATARLTLSTADVGSTESFDTQPRIFGTERRFDSHGAHHTVVYAGWAPKSV